MASNCTSVNGPVGKTGFHAAAHVQGIGTTANLSGWIADSNGVQPIPEPATVVLTLVGLGSFGALGLRRRRKSEEAAA